jgi:hypothetical protein
VRVEGDPVDDRGDEAGVGEDGAPFAERQVGPDRDGGSFFPLGDDLEQQLGAAWVDLDVAELVEQEEEFIMLVTIAYTGMRWGETIGLEGDLLLPSLINVEWQLREISGIFHRLPPKDDSYRSANWEPYLPVDLPPFLADLLTA